MNMINYLDPAGQFILEERANHFNSKIWCNLINNLPYFKEDNKWKIKVPGVKSRSDYEFIYYFENMVEHLQCNPHFDDIEFDPEKHIIKGIMINGYRFPFELRYRIK